MNRATTDRKERIEAHRDQCEAENTVEINHTEAREFDEFVKRQVTAAATLLEISWRASLRKERDARLNEVRLKEKFKQERDRYAAEVVELNKRIEALQGTVR